MCLIALALGASERFPFVIAANRDEFLERPTAALSHWQTSNGTSVLSGRDLQAGGIWMGFAQNGRFAMLTNVRQPHIPAPEQPISRGGLALAWLESVHDITLFAEQLDAPRYQGFNLIAGDIRSQQCFYLTNQAFLKPFEPTALIKHAPNAIDLVVSKMPWGQVYGLSNAALDTPWPKTNQLKQALKQQLNAANTHALASHCLDALANQTTAPDDELPDTGVALELERALSSVFVRHPADLPRYGTRTSLVAALHRQGELEVTEATHSPGSQAAQIQRAHFAAWVA